MVRNALPRQGRPPLRRTTAAAGLGRAPQLPLALLTALAPARRPPPVPLPSPARTTGERGEAVPLPRVRAQLGDVQPALVGHAAKGVGHRHHAAALLVQDLGCPRPHVAKALQRTGGREHTHGIKREQACKSNRRHSGDAGKLGGPPSPRAGVPVVQDSNRASQGQCSKESCRPCCPPAQPPARHLDDVRLALDPPHAQSLQQLPGGEYGAPPGGCVAAQAAVHEHWLRVGGMGWGGVGGGVCVWCVCWGGGGQRWG